MSPVTSTLEFPSALRHERRVTVFSYPDLSDTVNFFLSLVGNMEDRPLSVVPSFGRHDLRFR